MNDRADASRAHLLGRLAVVETRVRAAVARRRERDPNPDDAFRGLYLSDDHVDRLLEPAERDPPSSQAVVLLQEVEEIADAAEVAGADLRLRRLARTFELTALDVEVLLVALAPDLDSRFERLFGYLHDDVTRRRASVGLAFELSGVSATDPVVRSCLIDGAPLVAAHLVVFEEQERHFLTRSLRVPDRVVMHLLGSDRPDPLVEPLVAEPRPGDEEEAEALARAISMGAELCYIRERAGTSAAGLAVAAFDRLGVPSVALDLRRLGSEEDVAEIAVVAAREAGLRGGGLVAGPVECLVDRGAAAVRAFAESPSPTVLTGGRGWDPVWSRSVPLIVQVPLGRPEARARVWGAVLDGDAPDDPAFRERTETFRLAPEQVERAAMAARLLASYASRNIVLEDVIAGARFQNSAGLERLARRIQPEVGWDDLVLPQGVKAELRELAARVRHRDRVLDEWGLHRGGGRGRGITALFAGESGTGKTMAAEVLAGEFGFDLYAIDLATVVDKYVGETEKNLDRIFSEAEGVNGLLFFDEADALFGKRSEVRDAHDRYANVEVAYLLQRMETFDGIAVLATNLRANIDEAFTRRLDAIVDFPMPDEEHRRLLWDRCLGAQVPRSDDLDLEFCAKAFRLSGGNIRNIAVAAAYFAADACRAVAMRDVIRATELEYRKLGRLVVESEFGPYLDLPTDDRGVTVRGDRG